MAEIVAHEYEQYLPKYAKGRLLDLGCGKVPLYGAYRHLVSENYCVDWGGSPHEIRHLDLCWDLCQPLPLQSDYFDTVILSDVLEHIADPDLLMGEVFRLLKKDGYLIMNVPFFYCIHESPYDFYRYTKFALERIIKKSGLTTVEIKATGGSIEVISDILSKHFQFIPIVGKFLALSLQYGVLLARKLAHGKIIAKKTTEAYPYGYFVIAKKLN
jgi:SAM-dependent methyltransferase